MLSKIYILVTLLAATAANIISPVPRDEFVPGDLTPDQHAHARDSDGKFIPTDVVTSGHTSNVTQLDVTPGSKALAEAAIILCNSAACDSRCTITSVSEITKNKCRPTSFTSIRISNPSGSCFPYEVFVATQANCVNHRRVAADGTCQQVFGTGYYLLG